jgi:DUF4097 and DUF4098 domain-containing protein YvlB
MAHARRPSLLGALFWTIIGLLFLLHNFGIVPDLWSIASRYWPVLLILLGLGKILEYFLKKDAVSIRIGEIIGIIFLLLIGTAVTRISESSLARMFREIPIPMGGTSMRPGQWIGESHTYSEEVVYPLDPPLPLWIENSYGDVLVSPGSDREVRVRLRKRIYADEARAKSIAAEIHLQGGVENQAPQAGEAKAEAEPAKKGESRFFAVRTNRDSLISRNYRFNTDLELLVPKNSQVQVRNSYGEVRAAEINGKIDLSTTHRTLELRNCTGEFNVSNRYGECRLADLKGNLTVDGRGSVSIQDIKGDVAVKNEYSPLEIRNVDGMLTVTITESDLTIERVTKPLVIIAHGTQVRVADLQDSLKISANHGNVDISQVASRVNIDSRYTTLSLKEIKGDVEINSSSDNISVDDVGGHFTLMGKGSGIRANGVRGPLDIRTSLKEVVVNNFGGSCRISNEFAGISVSSERLGKGNVTIQNRNGDVDLYLPQNASFTIDATARNGKVESQYTGLNPSMSSNVGSLKSSVKSGGPRITLETDHSDIRVYPTQGGESQEPVEEAPKPVPPESPAVADRSFTVLPESI